MCQDVCYIIIAHLKYVSLVPGLPWVPCVSFFSDVTGKRALEGLANNAIEKVSQKPP